MNQTETFDPYHVWLGIRKQDRPPHHYRLLGIGLLESDPSVIENAADRQMAHLRAVAGGRNREASQQLLNELAAAKVCLLTPHKKAAYDRELVRSLREKKARLEGSAPEAPPSPPPAAVPFAQPLAQSPPMAAMAAPVGPPVAQGQPVPPAVTQGPAVGQPVAMGTAVSAEPDLPLAVGKSQGKKRPSISRTAAKRKRQQSKSNALIVIGLIGTVTVVLLVALIVILQQPADSPASGTNERAAVKRPSPTGQTPVSRPAPARTFPPAVGVTPAAQGTTSGEVPAGWPRYLESSTSGSTSEGLPPVEAPGIRVGN